MKSQKATVLYKSGLTKIYKSMTSQNISLLFFLFINI